EADARALGPHELPRLAVVGKQSGVEVVVEVDQEAQVALAHLEPALGAREPLIARSLRRPRAARLDVHLVGRELERRGEIRRQLTDKRVVARVSPLVLAMR